MPMAGYYSTRLLKGIDDDLHAKAIVIASGDQQAALVACDLIGLPPDVIEEARKLIQSATGIPGINVMISATHSHTGPLIPGGGSRDGAYGGLLPLAVQYRRGPPRKNAQAGPLANAKPPAAPAVLWKSKKTSPTFTLPPLVQDAK